MNGEPVLWFSAEQPHWAGRTARGQDSRLLASQRDVDGRKRGALEQGCPRAGAPRAPLGRKAFLANPES